MKAKKGVSQDVDLPIADGYSGSGLN